MAPTDTATARRLRVPAAIWAGLIAGLAFLVIEMAMLMMMGQSPWGPPRMMGAIVLGRDVLPPPATFDLPAVAAAMMVHFPLSILYAFVLALALERLSLWPALLAGAVFGLAIYFINFYGFTALFPWFADARGLGSIAGHVLYGLVLAFSYKKLAR
ncbi:MAG: hypothetical protein AB7Q23_10515 [Hyphomonadaceae bacterium]